MSFGRSSSGYDGSVLQAQTIAQASQQAGQTVVSVDWTGTSGLNPELTRTDNRLHEHVLEQWRHRR